jgi:hypothetical protein
MSLFPSPRRPRTWLTAFLLVLLAAPAVAAPEAMPLVSPASLRPLIAQAQRVVAACAASASACKPSDAPPDAATARPTDPGGFAVHFDWLRSALHDAATDKPADRASAMQAAADRLTALASSLAPAAAGLSPEAAGAAPDFVRAHAAFTTILAREEFQGDGPPSAWDRFKARLWGILARIFEGVDSLGNAAPWIPHLLEWLFFLGAAVGLIYFLRQAFVRQRLRVSLNDGMVPTSGWARESTAWAELARTRAAAGEFREAIHCLYWSAIVLLEGRRLWRHDPSRTPREYVRLLEAGSAQRAGLRALTAALERTWYGLREATPADFAEAEAAFAQLSASRPIAPAGAPLAETA